MNAKQTYLLIPVENQVRELDPKLLLAYVAAERGYRSVIGPRREMHLWLNMFPKSIYLSKSTTTASIKVFRILRKLGHEIMAWDEEALVHPPDDVYFSRRLNPRALEYVTCLLAWGQDNAELWGRYPAWPRPASIRITGNPRGDMLRSEMHGFYLDSVKSLLERFGEFILVNTNFNHVNGFVPILNLIYREKGRLKFGRAAKGMTQQYAQGLQIHKKMVFEEFKRMIPLLHDRFKDYTIVVRPHPTENLDVYHRIAENCARIRVTNEGYIVPWLLAAKALVHNGCTTGVEAYAMGVPAISYRTAVNDVYDLGFYRLPNLLSHECFSFEELHKCLENALSGNFTDPNADKKKTLLEQYLSAQRGPLACELILDAIDELIGDRPLRDKPSLIDITSGNLATLRRRVVKRVKQYLPKYTHNSPEFQRHRYPGVSLEMLREKLSRFTRLLEKDQQPVIKPLKDQFFLIGG